MSKQKNKIVIHVHRGLVSAVHVSAALKGATAVIIDDDGDTEVDTDALIKAETEGMIEIPQVDKVREIEEG